MTTSNHHRDDRDRCQPPWTAGPSATSARRTRVVGGGACRPRAPLSAGRSRRSCRGSSRRRRGAHRAGLDVGDDTEVVAASRLSLSVMSFLAGCRRRGPRAANRPARSFCGCSSSRSGTDVRRPALSGAADEQIAGERLARPSPSTKPMPPGGTAHFQQNSGSVKCATGSVDQQPPLDLVRCLGDVRRRPAQLLHERPPNVLSISRYCATRSIGPASCTQPPFMPRSTRFDLVEGVVAVLLLPQIAADRVERHAEAVADPDTRTPSGCCPRPRRRSIGRYPRTGCSSARLPSSLIRSTSL